MLDMIFKLNSVALGIIGVIVVILLTSIGFSLSLSSKYKKILADIRDRDNRENKIFEYNVLNDIVKDFKSARDRHIEEINSMAIIEKNIMKSLSKYSLLERFIKQSVSLMIILGLVGTFYGLTLSISDLVALLTNASASVVGDVNSITEGLILAVRSMSVAFVTSLFGIVSAIVVTIIKVLISIDSKKEQLILETEEYIDNTLSKKSRRLDDVNDNGKTNLEVSLDAFGDQIESNLKELTSEISYRLTHSSKEMYQSAEIIKDSIDKFDQSLDKFNSNVRDFSEFNHHLKTNIERMSVAFDDLTTDLKTIKYVDESSEKTI